MEDFNLKNLESSSNATIFKLKIFSGISNKVKVIEYKLPSSSSSSSSKIESPATSSPHYPYLLADHFSGPEIIEFLKRFVKKK